MAFARNRSAYSGPVDPETGMDALEQDPADFRLAVQDQDALRARVARTERRAHAGGPTADHDHVVLALRSP